MDDYYVEVNLQDAESEEQFKIKLSQSDALRAQTDITFATTLLNVARQTLIQNEAPQHVPSFSTCSSNNTLVKETFDTEMDISREKNGEEESSVDGFRWPHAAIMLLLEEYRQREENTSSGKITHKKAWDQIAEVMNANGYFVTSKQCTTRINTMKRTYKAVKDHNGKFDNNKRTWQYFEIMERFLGEKPYMAPLSTISSTGAATSRGRSASISSASSSSSVNSCAISDIVLDDNDHVPRKRKTNDIAQAILKSRRMAELEKERRHKERMETKFKLIEKLDKILEKI